MYGNKRAFVAGALVGGLLALVFAPKSGKELRGDLEEHSERLIDKTYGLAERGLELSKGVSARSSEIVTKIKGAVSHEKEFGEEAYSEYDVVIPPLHK